MEFTSSLIGSLGRLSKLTLLVLKSTSLGGLLPFKWDSTSNQIEVNNMPIYYIQEFLAILWVVISMFQTTRAWHLSDSLTQICSLAVFCGFFVCIGGLKNCHSHAANLVALFSEFLTFECNWSRGK